MLAAKPLTQHCRPPNELLPFSSFIPTTQRPSVDAAVVAAVPPSSVSVSRRPLCQRHRHYFLCRCCYSLQLALLAVAVPLVRT